MFFHFHHLSIKRPLKTTLLNIQPLTQNLCSEVLLRTVTILSLRVQSNKLAGEVGRARLDVVLLTEGYCVLQPFTEAASFHIGLQ